MAAMGPVVARTGVCGPERGRGRCRSPPTTSIALAGHPDVAGTASSFLGVARVALGGPAAPLVGLGGGSAVPRGLVTVGSAALAATAHAVAVRVRPVSAAGTRR
jgi:DHA1 family bicyclomycin/chloramphenicol resistance-like MFS transporter